MDLYVRLRRDGKTMMGKYIYWYIPGGDDTRSGLKLWQVQLHPHKHNTRKEFGTNRVGISWIGPRIASCG